ncbi:MAG: 2,4-dienoyl-CoA reductase-like NADH-dependent reductase (Old Yellow Enzyme family), partial [Bradymonadia bacterium]
MTLSVFEPGAINGAQLRNRIIKTATYEGMSPGGVPSPRLTEHHVELARGGVGMTTVAYCAVSPEGRTFAEQMWMSTATQTALSSLVRAVHAEGASVSVQLGHCGGFSKDKSHGQAPLGPMRAFNPYGIMVGLPFTRAMTEDDIARTVHDFAEAALHAKQAGFDAVEVHLGHGYLLSQWLSPVTNRRRDRHGGSLENRLLFPLMVVEAVRDAVGPEFPILAKINVSDGIKGGLEIEDAVVVSRAIVGAGVDAIVTSGGFVSRNAFYLLRGARPLRHMIAVEKNWAQKIAMAVFGPFLVPKV